jgi:asparagine synthetase B (glutamine-hydrolysing)
MDIGRDIVIRRFWSFAELDRTPWTDDQPLEEMCRQHLLNSTRQAVFSGLAAGGADKSVIALSSGLDSSSVAAACKKLGQPLPAFTARYDVNRPSMNSLPRSASPAMFAGTGRRW